MRAWPAKPVGMPERLVLNVYVCLLLFFWFLVLLVCSFCLVVYWWFTVGVFRFFKVFFSKVVCFCCFLLGPVEGLDFMTVEEPPGVDHSSLSGS